MANSKYTLYKYVKVDGTWRYCKAAYHETAIKPDIVFVNVKQALLKNIWKVATTLATTASGSTPAPMH